MKLPVLALTAFGLGFMRPASGTWGSTPPPALALLLVIVLGREAFDGRAALIVDAALVVTGLLFAVACVRWGRDAEILFGKKDPGQVVADEVAGQSIALLALPWRAMTEERAFVYNVALAATAFFAFRFFDILKPPPARQLERLPAGWGILVDDLFAGLYALVATQLLARLVWPHLL